MPDTTADTTPRPLRNPRGYHATRVDGTGRLKLPSRFSDYIHQLAEQTLFATKIKNVARIYVNGAWERELDKLAPEPALRKRMARTAEAFGGDVDLDPQGRVTLPQKLREALELENKQVQLRFFEMFGGRQGFPRLLAFLQLGQPILGVTGQDPPFEAQQPIVLRPGIRGGDGYHAPAR